MLWSCSELFFIAQKKTRIQPGARVVVGLILWLGLSALILVSWIPMLFFVGLFGAIFVSLTSLGPASMSFYALYVLLPFHTILNMANVNVTSGFWNFGSSSGLAKREKAHHLRSSDSKKKETSKFPFAAALFYLGS